MKELLGYLFQATDDQAGWFAPLKPAIEGLSEAQARWKPEWADHSVAGILAHLHFYHRQELEKFRSRPVPAASGNNDTTFAPPAEGDWSKLVEEARQTLQDWRREISSADPDKLKASSSLIGDLATHLAYHTGQIVLLRKAQGSWNPANGVH